MKLRIEKPFRSLTRAIQYGLLLPGGASFLYRVRPGGGGHSKGRTALSCSFPFGWPQHSWTFFGKAVKEPGALAPTA